jgi:pimeloyl-ACP methyl ester carboxylesterase
VILATTSNNSSNPNNTLAAKKKQQGNFKEVREIPVILIPGMMGSRMQTPDGDIKWDPDNLFSAPMRDLIESYSETVADNILGVTTPLIPVTECAQRPNRESQFWGGLAWSCYGKFLEELDCNARSEIRSLTNSDTRAYLKIYGFAYDWRKSNNISARRLKARIDHISKKHNNAEVIIVTHSMGGLVAREYCRLNNNNNVLAVIHAVQPTIGAPICFRRLKTGCHKSMGDDMMGLILGFSPKSFCAIFGSMYGPAELLPTKEYPTGWLTLAPSLRNRCHPNIYTQYKTENFAGAFPKEWRNAATGNKVYKRRRFLWDCINEAENFHKNLKLSDHHPHTHIISSDGLPTEIGVELLNEEGEISRILGTGDTTVPISSQEALIKKFGGPRDEYCGICNKLVPKPAKIGAVHRYYKTVHMEAMNSDLIISGIYVIIRFIIAGKYKMLDIV